SLACQKEAAHWRRWKGCQEFRASERGKERRRQQSRRYRQRRQQQRAACWEETLRAIDVQVTQEDVAAKAQLQEVTAQLEAEEPREGQRPAPNPKDFPCLPCQRPGCYELFPLRPSVPQQRYCCCLC